MNLKWNLAVVCFEVPTGTSCFSTFSSATLFFTLILPFTGFVFSIMILLNCIPITDMFFSMYIGTI